MDGENLAMVVIGGACLLGAAYLLRPVPAPVPVQDPVPHTDPGYYALADNGLDLVRDFLFDGGYLE